MACNHKLPKYWPLDRLEETFSSILLHLQLQFVHWILHVSCNTDSYEEATSFALKRSKACARVSQYMISEQDCTSRWMDSLLKRVEKLAAKCLLKNVSQIFLLPRSRQNERRQYVRNNCSYTKEHGRQCLLSKNVETRTTGFLMHTSSKSLKLFRCQCLLTIPKIRESLR